MIGRLDEAAIKLAEIVNKVLYMYIHVFFLLFLSPDAQGYNTVGVTADSAVTPTVIVVIVLCYCSDCIVVVVVLHAKYFLCMIVMFLIFISYTVITQSYIKN